MIYLHKKMYSFDIDTLPKTEVFRNTALIDPNTINYIVEDETVKREHFGYDFSDKSKRDIDYKNKKDIILFMKEVASNFLYMKNYNHNKDEWYMDIIRYNLDNDLKPINSGLAWHCENDNYSDLITVLIYTRFDSGIINGNLEYIDSYNVKQTLKIETNTVIIMDGNIQHCPEDPIGTGKRDVIIVSFKKY